MQVLLHNMLATNANLIVRSMQGKVLQCCFQRHKIRHICLNGIYHTVISHSTFHNVILPGIDFSTTVSDNEVKPFYVVFLKTFIAVISLHQLNIQLIYTDNTFCHTDARHAVCPVVGLFFQVCNIESAPEIKSRTPLDDIRMVYY